MYWQQTKAQISKIKVLPHNPKTVIPPTDDQQVLFYGWFWKKHPLFKNKWSERFIMITTNQFMWADDYEDALQFQPSRCFRRTKIDSLKPACGPNYLPGVAFKVDGKDYAFSHDNPRYTDRLFNFMAVYMGIMKVEGAEDHIPTAKDQQAYYQSLINSKTNDLNQQHLLSLQVPYLWPNPDDYRGQFPVTKIDPKVPGEQPSFPNPAFRSEPLFTPSQVSFYKGTRVFCMTLLIINKQELRVLITNEMIYAFDDYGNTVQKLMPSEVRYLTRNKQSLPINSLDLLNRDFHVHLAANEVLNFQQVTGSATHWNAAIAAFMGIIPALDCIKNVEQFAENEQDFQSMFENVDREFKVFNTASKMRATQLTDDEASGDEGYFEIHHDNSSAKDAPAIIQVDQSVSIGSILYNNIMEIEPKKEDSVQQPLSNKQSVDKQRGKKGRRGAGRKTKQELKHQSRVQKRAALFQQLQQQMLQKLTNEIDIQKSDSFECPVEDILQDNKEICDLQERAFRYSLSTLTKILDSSDQSIDPKLNTWGLLLPNFDNTEAAPDVALLVDEAAQVRRKVLKEYCLKLNFNIDNELVLPQIPEPFGEAEEFINKLQIMVPTNLQPDSIGVPFPTGEVLSENARHVRQFLSGKYAEVLAMYNELLKFTQKFLDIEYDHRNKDNEKHLILDPTIELEEPFQKLIPTFLQYEPYPSPFTAISIYKIIVWYQENINLYLGSELRKSIAAETLLLTKTDNKIVQEAAQELLADGEFITEKEAEVLVNEIAQLDAEQEHQYYSEMDVADVMYYGHNLHIFGAAEQLRRASSLIVECLISRLEARVIRQWGYYFISMGNKLELEDFAEAEKYISKQIGANYMQVFVSQHAWHIIGLSHEIIDLYAERYIKASSRHNFTNWMKASNQQHAEFHFTSPFSKWIFKDNFIRLIEARGCQVQLEPDQSSDSFTYKKRGNVLERVTGSRPDEQLPSKEWMHWLCDSVLFCKLDDGLMLKVVEVLKYQHKDEDYIFTSVLNEQIVCSFQTDYWDVTFITPKEPTQPLPEKPKEYKIAVKGGTKQFISEYTVEKKDGIFVYKWQLPTFLSPFTVVFMIFKHTQLTQYVQEISVTQQLFRLLSYNAPLDQQGFNGRKIEDANDSVGMIHCEVKFNRPLVSSSAELQEMLKVFDSVKE